jgi:hypothetical protein
MRDHDVKALTSSELDRARRELQASLALVQPNSPARVPILAHMSAIDAELAGRDQARGVPNERGARIPSLPAVGGTSHGLDC